MTVRSPSQSIGILLRGQKILSEEKQPQKPDHMCVFHFLFLFILVIKSFWIATHHYRWGKFFECSFYDYSDSSSDNIIQIWPFSLLEYGFYYYVCFIGFPILKQWKHPLLKSKFLLMVLNSWEIVCKIYHHTIYVKLFLLVLWSTIVYFYLNSYSIHFVSLFLWYEIYCTPCIPDKVWLY